MQPSQLREWHSSRSEFFDRAAEDVGQAVSRFLKDWAIDAGVRVVGQPTARVKSVERIWSKLLRRLAEAPGMDLSQFDDLLRNNSLVGDLVGVRFVVRGLNDLGVLMRSMNENAFLGEPPFVGTVVDDKNARPSSTGYRAVHVNTCLEVTIRGEMLAIPIEVQIKTGLQDNWGTFTHDIAYERTDLHDDPQFIRLRELQRLLADSLDVADQLNRSVEEIYRDFVESRTLGEGSSALTLDAVLTIVNDANGVIISVESATRLLDTAKFCGFATVSALRDVVNNQDALQELAERLEVQDGVYPGLVDLLIEVMESRITPP